MQSRLIAIIIVVTTGLLSAPQCSAADDNAENAASIYRQAFRLFTFPKDPALRKILSGWETAPLEDAKRAIAPTGPAIALLAKAAAVPRCDWGLDYSQGLGLALPEMHTAPPLIWASCLKIRILCEGRQFDEAVDLAINLMTLGRRLTLQKLIVSRLVGQGCEEAAAKVLARYLPAIPPAQLAVLESRLARLPEDIQFSESVRNEATMTLITIRAGKQVPEVPNLPADAAAREQLAGQVQMFWDHVVKLASVPMPTVIQERSKLAEVFASVPPMARPFVTDPAELAELEARAIEMRDLFQTALALSVNGTGALASHPDPFGNSPFSYKQIAGGIELQASLTWKDKPVQLRTGPKAFD